MGQILDPGRNCSRVARAPRAKLLIDADAYFSTLRRAACAARDSIFVIGWDIDSRIAFPPGGPDDGLPRELGAFLDALVARSKTLRIFVLDWDFVVLYALDRELLPIYNLGWRTHERLHFHLDDRHPPGGSHHQKIVVIDDALAFVGGIDLTKCRWDTPAHAPDDPRRRTPDGEPYAPFHDMQMMVDGEAAQAIGELARDRWRRATGNEAPPAASREANRDHAWPADAPPDFENAHVGIARTEPAYEGAPAVGEVRQLYIDAIASATDSIYIENQYFTASAIAEAIAARLREPEGPEVVIVTRRTGGGWLEENTMEVLRARLLRDLEPRDLHGRLRVYCPEHAKLDGDCINVHSKLMIVDDRLIRVGSANLNNRSMGFDTECDIAIEAEGETQARAILELRNRLLAEHLDVDPARIAQAITAEGSLIAAIESLRGNERSLEPLEPKLDPDVDRLVPDSSTIDPEKPIDPDELVDNLVPADDRTGARTRIVGLVALLAAIAALAAAWRWGPLADWLDRETLREAAAALEASPLTPLWMLLGYLAAALTAFPITLLIVATAIVFGPWAAVGYALTGSLLGAGLTFALGHLLGRRAVRQIAGKRLNRLSRRLGDGGVFAVVALRMVPVAPFTVVNLVAGASHIRFRDFAIGTVFGMTPGILAIAVFSDRVAAAMNDPSATTIATLVLALVVLVGVLWLIQRWLRRRSDAGAGTSDRS